MAKATLNKYGIATDAGDITVYNYDGETREYLSSAVEFLAVGVGIPAHSCTDAPIVKKDGFAVCRTASLNGWEYVTDHRGEAVYSTKTGEPIKITVLGDYSDNITALAPSTIYDRWNGNEWITDKDSQKNAQILEVEQKKAVLRAEAQSIISLWQTELQLGIISNEDKASLIAWLAYIKALKSTDVSTLPDINWPELPIM